MGLRVAFAGIHHESNTFSAIPATLERFEDGGIHRRADIRLEFADSHSSPAGFLETGTIGRVDIEPILYANVNPSGPVTRSAYLFLLNEILAELHQEGPFDGVLLAQHGAAVGEGIPDLDGDVLEQVRGVVGPNVGIGVALDMHANVSNRVVDQADVVVGYQTNPHIDPRTRARHCAEILLSYLRRETLPVTALVSIPIALHIALQDTSTKPMKELLDVTRWIEASHGLLSASLMEGFPYADVPQMGMSVITVADGDTQSAMHAAEFIAAEVWHRRSELTIQLPSPADALADAATTLEPTMVLDVGDNVLGGSTGDSTVLLHEARAQRIGGVFQTLLDPRAANHCLEVGEGAKVSLEVGGQQPGTPSKPFPIHGRVVATSAGSYEDPTPTHGGFRHFHGGRTAVIETDDGITILLTSRLVPNTSLQQLLHIGLNPADFSVLIAKGVNSPKAAYKPIVDRMIYADTPGVTAANLNYLTFQNRPRVYPFEDWDWTPSAYVSAQASTRRGRQ